VPFPTDPNPPVLIGSAIAVTPAATSAATFAEDAKRNYRTGYS
jgi:hypothetical protein